MQQIWIRKGFSLIELLIVIALIGVLAAFFITNFQGSFVKSHDAQRQNDLKVIQAALESYYNDYHQYPKLAIAAISGSPPNISGTDYGNCISSSTIDSSFGTSYLPAIPKDPVAGTSYHGYNVFSPPSNLTECYFYVVHKDSSSGLYTSYALFALLQSTESNNCSPTMPSINPAWTIGIGQYLSAVSCGPYQTHDLLVGSSPSYIYGFYNYWVTN